MNNNNSTFRFVYVQDHSVPYTCRFEADFLTAGQDYGCKSAAIRWAPYNPYDGQTDYPISPPVGPEAGAYGPDFEMARQLVTTDAKDSLFVLASSDCGFSFPHSPFCAAGPQLYTVTGNTPADFIPPLPGNRKRLSVEITESLSNQTFLSAFVS